MTTTNARIIPKNRLSIPSGSRPYPMKHKMEPAQSSKAKKPVNSCRRTTYQGVAALSVSEFSPSYLKSSSAYLVLRPVSFEVLNFCKSLSRFHKCSSHFLISSVASTAAPIPLFFLPPALFLIWSILEKISDSFRLKSPKTSSNATVACVDSVPR